VANSSPTESPANATRKNETHLSMAPFLGRNVRTQPPPMANGVQIVELALAPALGLEALLGLDALLELLHHPHQAARLDDPRARLVGRPARVLQGQHRRAALKPEAVLGHPQRTK